MYDAGAASASAMFQPASQSFGDSVFGCERSCEMKLALESPPLPLPLEFGLRVQVFGLGFMPCR